MRYVSIYLLPDVIEEGAEVYDLKQRFKGAEHDGVNILFADVHPNAVNPIITTSLVDEEGNPMQGDLLVAALAKILFSTDRSRAIHIPFNDAVALHKHPAWRLWCAKYEDKDELEKDHEKAFGVGVDRRKSLDTLKDQAREEIRAAFNS
jgi:hypothetical protein